ncbi:MAG: carbon-phosphorus lyase complex subunit PhnI [Pseudomonadota bacterium]
MYVATKGGEQAIAAAHEALHDKRTPRPGTDALSIAQIADQLSFAVARVMAEGSLYDPEIAALALKQAQGDLIEAIFLVRAYRSTLPRFGYSCPLETAKMRLARRISATFKDLPGGQTLGPTFDYTHRLLDFDLLADEEHHNVAASDNTGCAANSADDTRSGHANEADEPVPRVTDLLGAEGLIEPDAHPADGMNGAAVNGTAGVVSHRIGAGEAAAHAVSDLTRQPMIYPAPRDLRLQRLARGDEGFLLGMGYSSQRGFARSHPFAGEIRMGRIAVEIDVPDFDAPVTIGEVTVTECQMINQFAGSKTKPPQFTRGYGLVFGHSERKAMSMALVDRALRARDLEEDVTAPVQDEEFVLAHADNVEATGFVEHLKLPHYVDFQAELELIRRLRAQADDQTEAEAGDAPAEPEAPPTSGPVPSDDVFFDEEPTSGFGGDPA